MSYLINNKIDEDACLLFLSKYGRGELTDSVLKFINDNDGLPLDEIYSKWVKWKDTNRINFGGRAEHIKSSFGEKTFFKYDWGEVQTWSEIFEYLYISQKGD